MPCPRIALGQFRLERHIRQQVHLAQNHQLRLHEDRRILQRLVFAFGHAQNHDLQMLAQIVAARAHQVSYILDDEYVEAVQRPVRQVLLDHLRIQMARASGDDLLYRETRLRQPVRIVFRLQISGQQHHALALVPALQRALQQGGLARSRRTDDVDHKNLVLAEFLTQLGGKLLIFVQYFLFDRDLAHSSTSTNAIWSSSPAMVIVAASPQSGQAVAQFSALNSALHCGHRWRRDTCSISRASVSQSVSFTTHSKPKRRQSTSTPASSPTRNPTLENRAPSCCFFNSSS